MSGTKLVSDLGLRCQACARLRFGSQGCYRLRYPWDPQAVSDPWLVEEFGRQRNSTASGGECQQGQVAREAPAKTTRTVPLEFKDNETGEDFDVIGDDDMLPYPGEEPGGETRERVYGRAERGVEEGGRGGATVRPAQAVPREWPQCPKPTVHGRVLGTAS